VLRNTSVLLAVGRIVPSGVKVLSVRRRSATHVVCDGPNGTKESGWKPPQTMLQRKTRPPLLLAKMLAGRHKKPRRRRRDGFRLRNSLSKNPKISIHAQTTKPHIHIYSMHCFLSSHPRAFFILAYLILIMAFSGTLPFVFQYHPLFSTLLYSLTHVVAFGLFSLSLSWLIYLNYVAFADFHIPFIPFPTSSASLRTSYRMRSI
jgi:hypothetical protein